MDGEADCLEKQVLQLYKWPHLGLLSRPAESVPYRQTKWQTKCSLTKNWTTAKPKSRLVLFICIVYSWPMQFALGGLDADGVMMEEMVHVIAEGGKDIDSVRPSVTVHLLWCTCLYDLHSFVHLETLWERLMTTIYQPG